MRREAAFRADLTAVLWVEEVLSRCISVADMLLVYGVVLVVWGELMLLIVVMLIEDSIDALRVALNCC